MNFEKRSKVTAFGKRERGNVANLTKVWLLIRIKGQGSPY